MHISTLRRVKTVEDVNKLYKVFDQLYKEGYNRTDITQLNGLDLNQSSFLLPLMSNQKLLEGHIIVDLKDDKVGLFKLDFTDDKIKPITAYDYASVGVISAEIIICNRPNHTSKDLVFNGGLLLSNIKDIQVDVCDFLIILLLEYDDYHSILCLNDLDNTYVAPKNLDEFIIWFSNAVEDTDIPSSTLSSVVSSVKNNVFGIDGFKPLVLTTERSC